jgi:hypothetical protein
MTRCGSGCRLLEVKPGIAALPVRTVSQGQIYDPLVGSRSRFETRTCRDKAIVLLAASEGRGAYNAKCSSAVGLRKQQNNIRMYLKYSGKVWSGLQRLQTVNSSFVAT